MTCWELLGLEPGAQPREIKRRFAQLVKINRPEDDPQAYQQLRDAYEAALAWVEEPDAAYKPQRSIIISNPEEEIAPPKVQIYSPLPPLGAIGPGYDWQTILDRLLEKSATAPENAGRQLNSALSQLELLDFTSRMRFEEALLLNLQQLFRPLLILTAAKRFRWHLVSSGVQAAIQAAMNESCILYDNIARQVEPLFFGGMSAMDEVECGDKLETLFYSLKNNARSQQWFDFALLMEIDKYDLSDAFLCQLSELVGWSYKPDKNTPAWSLSERFYRLSVMHGASYHRLVTALNIQGDIYTSSKVISSYLTAAEQGHVFSYIKLGEQYYLGTDVAKDDIQSAFWFTRAAEAGDITACHRLGVFYRDGIGVEVNKQKAFAWFLKAAQQNDEKSQYEVGKRYAEGNGVEKNDRLAFAWQLKSAEQGFSWAQLEVANMLRLGLGTEVDKVNGFNWCLKSAESGYDRAQCQLGFLYFHGHGVEQDYRQARLWYLNAARQGESAAKFNLGILYRDGLGVPVDHAKAFTWCYRSARQGFAQAQYSLALMYQDDRCDYQNAIYWLSRAYENGLPTAAFMLHKVYRDGAEGVEKDPQQSFTWCGRAALGGHKEAQEALSTLYFYGRGTEKNLVMAWAWVLIFGPVGAKLRIKRGMSPLEIAEAHELAIDLIEKYELESRYHPLPSA